ncbi:MAG: KEOPS complex subunit Cgi121 [Candidatus Thorarchaeota archaeon]
MITLYLEELFYNDSSFFVGISEIKNKFKDTKDQLLEIAGKQFDDIIAIQLLNSSLIVDEMHILSASQNAINAWNGDYAISRSLGLEIAVYASGQKQIGKALDSIGVTDGLEQVALVVVSKSKQALVECINILIAKIGEEVAEPFKITKTRFAKLKEFYEISSKEIETLTLSKELDKLHDALSRCVRSRVSLVAIES